MAIPWPRAGHLPAPLEHKVRPPAPPGRTRGARGRPGGGRAAAAAGGATRGRERSGSGGPHRARAVKFRPRSPSYILWRRRFGCGAKILDLDEDIGADGEAGVGHGGVVPGAAAGHAPNQVGAAVGANQVDGTTTSVRPGADHDRAVAGAGNVAEKMLLAP